METDLEKVAEAVIMMPTRLHSMPKMHTHTPTSSAIVIRALLTGLGRHITGDSMKSLDTAPCFLDTLPSQHFPCWCMQHLMLEGIFSKRRKGNGSGVVLLANEGGVSA